MESNQSDASESEIKYIDSIQFVGEVELVDPASLVSHPSSLWVYGDQDADTVARDTEFMIAIRKHGGNITPVLVDSRDRKTILSGDRRRTGCAILGFQVRVQYVNPGNQPGDVDDFIINSNLRRPQLTNLQLGRAVKLQRDAHKARQAAARAAQPTSEPVATEEAPKTTEVTSVVVQQSQTLAEAFPSVVKEEAPAAKPVDDEKIVEDIAENMGVPKTRAQEAVKVVDHIDKLESEGKIGEAQQLTEKLNKSTRQAAETVRVRSDYNHTATAVLKMVEKGLRTIAKKELEGLKKVPCCDPELRSKIMESYETLYRLVGELSAKEKTAAKSLPKNPKKKQSKDANESAPQTANVDVPADTVSGTAEAASTADSNIAAEPETQASAT